MAAFPPAPIGLCPYDFPTRKQSLRTGSRIRPTGLIRFRETKFRHVLDSHNFVVENNDRKKKKKEEKQANRSRALARFSQSFIASFSSLQFYLSIFIMEGSAFRGIRINAWEIGTCSLLFDSLRRLLRFSTEFIKGWTNYFRAMNCLLLSSPPKKRSTGVSW